MVSTCVVTDKYGQYMCGGRLSMVSTCVVSDKYGGDRSVHMCDDS